MSRIGDRTFWHATSCAHWDIRRYATISGLVPGQLRYLPQPSSAGDDSGGRPFYWHEYSASCIRFLRARFESFEGNLSAMFGYRRISLDFTIDLDHEFRLKAYAQPGDQPKIFLSAGILLAAEEAAHILFSGSQQVFFNTEFDLWSNSYGGAIPSHAVTRGARVPFDVLRDYSTAFQSIEDNEPVRSLQSTLRGIGAKAEKLDQLFGFLSNPDDFTFLHMCFSRIAMSSSRQVVADEFSMLCAYWMIGHEDAHRYLGHLGYFFGSVGAAELDELSTSSFDDEFAALRRASELQADTAAIHRQVDLAYDVEFVGMIFDMVDPGIRRKIWRGGSENSGLDSSQRNFALRYIAGSAVTPLLLLEISRMRTGAPTSPHYPPLYVRFLNIALEVFNRAIATQVNQSHYLVGAIENASEIYNFFGGFLHDTFVTYAELTSFCTEDDRQVEELFDLGAEAATLFSPTTTLQLTLLASNIHGIVVDDLYFSPDSSKIMEQLKSDEFNQSGALVKQFLQAKSESLEHEATSFADSRQAANQGDELRSQKVLEDIRRAQSNSEYIDARIRPLYSSF